MTTVVNNPAPAESTGGTNYLLGTILLIGAIMILLYFGIPIMKRFGQGQITLPATQVVVPSTIDVNVTKEE